MAGKVAEAIGIIAIFVISFLAIHGYASTTCATDPLALTPLSGLQLDNSNTDQELFNRTFVSEVGSSAQSTVVQIVPQTIAGYSDSSQQYRELFISWMQNAPPWISEGISAALNNSIASLFAAIYAATSGPQAVNQVESFAAAVGGLSVASINLASFNGVTAIQAYFQTGSVDFGLCQTFPAQIGQLYKAGFDPNVSSDLRAHYLGQALAITAFMALMGGKDGFSAKLGDALDTMGLTEAWPTIKPYLQDIGTKVSADASAVVLSILQAVASHFPQDSIWASGLTADRIDAMVNTIQQNGGSNDLVENDIQNLVQASGNLASEDGLANTADDLSYSDGGGIQIKVQQVDNRIILYDDGTGKTESISTGFLQDEIPGFDPEGPDFIQIHYHEQGVTAYHYFPPRTGPTQTTWSPAAPQFASPGEIITVSFDLLTENEFLKSTIPSLGFINDVGAKWVTGSSAISGFDVLGDQIQIQFSQFPEVNGFPTHFLVQGTVSPLDWAAGDTFVKITLPDRVSEDETLKLTFDGYGYPTLSFESGSNFNRVIIISSDGVRLRIVYDSGGSNPSTATIYLQDPSVLDTLATMEPGSTYGIQSVSQGYQIQQVTFNRQLEVAMLNLANKNDLGRLGAEIAYTVGEQKFGLSNLQLNEITQGGADLATKDGTVEIQARFLNLGSPTPGTLASVLQSNLVQMTSKLADAYQIPDTNMKIGYAILSYYTTTSGLQTIILVVPASIR